MSALDAGENTCTSVQSESKQLAGPYVKKGDSFACTLKSRRTQLFVHDQAKAAAGWLALSPAFFSVSCHHPFDHHRHLILAPPRFFLVTGKKKRGKYHVAT
jgi:hypothetical protein